MPWFLKKRQPHLTEYMDREDSDPALLNNTYLQFAVINLLISGWRKIYKKHLRPLMHGKQRHTLLDIGFGGGDIAIKLAEWAKKDGFQLDVTAIDTDRRAYDFVTQIYPDELVHWEHTSSAELVAQNRTFDFVISNHLVHHLQDYQLLNLLGEAQQLARQKIIFNDIRRSSIGYLMFTTLARFLFSNSFIVQDGLMSIKRSYTKSELQSHVPKSWKVHRVFPFRLLLTHDKN